MAMHPPNMRPVLLHMPVAAPPVHHAPPGGPLSPTESVAQPVDDASRPMPKINVGGVSYPAPSFASPGFFKTPPPHIQNQHLQNNHTNDERLPSIPRESPQEPLQVERQKSRLPERSRPRERSASGTE